MFTIGSLFDGSGGFPLAATLAGGTPVWAAEIEPYPIAVTRSRFPNMEHLGSVTEVKGDKVTPVALISIGSPCQDFSIAGKRAGLKHTENGDEETTRSGLFMEAVRIIKEMREATNGKYPQFAVWENVPGAFSSNKGEDFRTVLEELIKIVEPGAVMPPVPKNGWAYADSYCGDGWSLAYRVLDAQFWGVPQRRRRVFLTLDLTGNRARAICFEREGLRGHFETFRTAREEVARDAVCGAETTDCEGDGIIAVATQQGGAEITTNGICPTVTAAAGMSGNNQPWVAYPNDYVLDDQGGSQINVRTDGQCPTLRAEMHGNIPCVIEAAGFDMHNQQSTGDVSRTLKTPVGGDDLPVVYIKEQYLFENHSQDSRYRGPLDVCPMLPAQLGTGGNNQPFVVSIQGNTIDRNAKQNGSGVCENVAHTLVAKGPGAVGVQYIVRRLTPTECARLQGFPDEWGHPDPKEDFTDEEYRFWSDVRNTHAAINGKAVKDYAKPAMVKWYNKLHTDSSEYKMWGNGIALPCAVYIMQGIAEALIKEAG